MQTFCSVLNQWFLFIGIYKTIEDIWKIYEKHHDGQIHENKRDTVIALLLTIAIQCTINKFK